MIGPFTFDQVLLVVTAVFVVFLFVMEAETVKQHIPTISARLQALGQAAPIARNLALIAVGYFAAHFFDR